MAARKGRGSRAGVRRGELTPEELKRTGEIADQGFTIRVSGPGAGRPARNVFSTGFSPEKGRASEVALDPSMPAHEQIGAFVESRKEDLSTPGARMGAGGWLDSATGIVGQDATVLTPRTREGLESALQIGTQGNQVAIGNLGHRSYVGDVVIPEHLQKGQFLSWHQTEGIDPKVEDVGIKEGPDGKLRPTVSIIPSRKEMVGVEADIMAEKMKLRNK